MSNKNNFSPLPFYDDKIEQKKWYAFGRDYVYLTPNKRILPFQIQREATTSIQKTSTEITADYIDNAYLDKDGNLIENASSKSGVGSIETHGLDTKYIYIENLPTPPFYSGLSEQIQGTSIAFLNTGGEVIKTLNPVPLGAKTWSGYITIPQDADTIYILQYTGGENATYFKAVEAPVPLESVSIFDADTDEQITTLDISKFNIVNKGDYDYICYNGNVVLTTDKHPTKMYVKVVDEDDNEWYSAYFGWCSACMEIRWWDDEDLEFDAGAVVYSNGYKNIMYFDAEIGMPDYEFEEEVAERSGYQFPISQVSYKRYRFNILAPEEVCDVMRFIRLSDHIQIVTNEWTYDATSFLITPTWQEQGYLAEVACEFTTNSVVKKIGKGVAVSKIINN